jgi:sugar lactone lactonase YvrE
MTSAHLSLPRRTSSIPAIAFLALAGLGIPPAAHSQTVYEDYTFTTLAGPVESPGAKDGTGSAARFRYPFGIAADSSGNVYLADTYNHTIRTLTPAGEVMTLAGLAGSSGSGDGTGSVARFSEPTGVAVDGSGNVYVADRANHTIRRITPAGVVTTLAGSPGNAGSADGTSTAARFNKPQDVAVDTNGNVYVADSGNHTIRKVTPAGVVTTMAGSAGNPGSVDGTGSAARFNRPSGVTVNPNGRVYVADTDNQTIRKVSPAGVVTTLAGLAGNTGSNDGTGPAARYNVPYDVALDSAGNVYVADTYNHTIRKSTSAGAVTTLAGLAGASGGRDGTGSVARFSFPTGVATDGSGNVYVADYSNCTIRKVTPAAAVTTLAGAVGGQGTANGAAPSARFEYPAGVAVDRDGNAYVADFGNHTIRKITSTGTVTTLSGTAGASGSIDGTGNAARFNGPTGVAVDGSGNVYVADIYNHTIRKVTPAGVVTTVAGLAGTSGSANGTGSAARFFMPFSVALDASGNIYVADTYNHTIRKITPAGVVTRLAGSAGNPGSADGTGSAARFNFPSGVATDDNGTLYVADSQNNIIRRVTPAGVVTTLAGSTNSTGTADGTGSAARFSGPFGVAADSGGSVYVTDRDNDLIRKITPSGVVTTLAGAPGLHGTDDGTGSEARFYYLEGVAVDRDGNVYVTDAYNHTIRQGRPALTDTPVVDLPLGKPGVTRHLDVTNLTTTSWSWQIVRRPAASLAQLSSTTVRNPIFTPDVADLYVMRFQGADISGRVVVRTLNLVSSGVADPQITGTAALGNSLVLYGTGGTPGEAYSVLASTSITVPLTNWSVLPGGGFDGSGRFVFTNEASLPARFYRIRVP